MLPLDLPGEAGGQISIHWAHKATMQVSWSLRALYLALSG
jgi:hypothetical protein